MSFIGDMLFDFLDFYIEESRHQEVVGAINKSSATHNKTDSQYAELKKRVAAVEAENKALKSQLKKGGIK